MERKIGEIFEYNGEWYQCIPDTTDDNCNNCFFQKRCSNITGDCSSTSRSDGKIVAFKKLEKVGSPFMLIVGSLKILYQRYNLPFPSKVILEVPWYRTIDKFIDIEIEENKEDKQNMVEKLKEYFAQASKEQLEKDLELLKRFNNSGLSVDDFIKENEQKKNLKPFDLEAAKSGKPVCTRDGRKARIVCFDAKGDKPIIALIEMGVAETPNNYPIDGKAISTKETPCDLMMLPEKKERWVNIYRNEKGEYWSEQILFSTKKDATDFVHNHAQYVTTVKISWEE